jgi:hypothetical protein
MTFGLNHTHGLNPTHNFIYTSWKVFASCAIFLAAAGTAAAVDIYPGTNIQSVVAANPAGTTYTLHSGVFRLQTIAAKNGDVYQGVPGTVLSGASLLTSFTQQGSYWVASGQTQQGSVSTTPPCASGWQGCEYPEQLFFDNVPLQHVETLSAVGPGKWYFDYAGHNIYFYDNPTGHTVETSITPNAFAQGGNNVTINGLTIEKYATPAQDGTIDAGTGWIIENSEIRLNHGMGIRLATGMQILSSYIHNNGQIGLSGEGDNIVVNGNEISYNNTAYFDYLATDGEAGATKFSLTNNLIVSNNYVHDNNGLALWLDANNYAWTIQSNRTANNHVAGILDEISYDGTIRFNVLENEGTVPNPAQTSLWYGAGIEISASSNAEIYGNTLNNSMNGIGAIANNRGAGDRGTYLVQNLYVHDNMTVQSGGYAAGMVADSGYLAAYTSQNNRFVNNTYASGNPAGMLYSWYSGGSNYTDMNTAQWIAAGEDVAGTWLSATAPSTQFASGNRVALTSSAAIYSLPTYSAPSSIVATISAGAPGTVTNVRGPIYASSAIWWQVQWDSGALGWTPGSNMVPAGASDTTPPSVGISTPYNGAMVSGNVPIGVVATDNVGVVKTQFYVDGVLIATDTAAPWGFTWNTSGFSLGGHVLMVVGYDAAGNHNGGVVTVTLVSAQTDTTPPSVGISTPFNHATVSGIVPIGVVATDNVGVVETQFYVDGVLVATDTTAPWGFTWNTSGFTPGSHVLTVLGYDAAGNKNGGVITVTLQ